MVSRRRWMVSIAGAFALSAAVMGCGNKSSSGEISPEGQTKPGAVPAVTEWRVGAYFSLSGPETQFGIDTKEGIDLAIDEVNKAGGVKNKPVKVLFEDDKSNPQEATNKVLQLIDRDKVVAILGEVASSRSKAGGIVANKKKIPMISPSSTNPDVTKVGPFVFRVCFTDDIQGQMGAQFVVNTLGKKKVAILFASDDLYSSGLAKEFRDEVKKLGGTLVIEKSFLKTETNFTTYLTEIRDAKPDMIYAPIYYTSMVPIARQAKAANIPGSMFVGGDGWDASTLIQDAGDEMDGAYFTNHYAADVPWPSAKVFLDSYKQRYSHDPTSLAAMGYDSAKLLADAIGRAKGDTPEAIRDAIQDTKGFQGATGLITINAERNAEKPVVIVQIKGKKFSYFGMANDKSEKAHTPPPASAAPATGSAAPAAPATGSAAVKAPAPKK
jgi:branched-chain amino acid transport system substrate-binding protein